MPHEKENISSRNIEKNHEYSKFYHLIPGERVLGIAMKGNADWLYFNFHPDGKNSWRYTSYQQYSVWYWGHLG